MSGKECLWDGPTWGHYYKEESAYIIGSILLSSAGGSIGNVTCDVS